MDYLKISVRPTVKICVRVKQKVRKKATSVYVEALSWIIAEL